MNVCSCNRLLPAIDCNLTLSKTLDQYQFGASFVSSPSFKDFLAIVHNMRHFAVL